MSITKKKIYKGGSLWKVLAKNNIKEGKRYKTLIYQEKKGNIPSLKNSLKYNIYFKENKYITKIENDPSVWNKKYSINCV